MSKKPRYQKVKYTSYRTNSVYRVISEMRLEKKSFKVVQTGYSTTIEFTEGGLKNRIFFYEPTGSSSRKRILELRAKILKCIDECNVVVDFVPPSKIRFFELDTLISEQTDSIVYNMDISAAYPTCLYNYGFITKELFDELMTECKEVRLKAIGSIATKKMITEFIRGRPSVCSLVTKEQGRNVFFLLCHEIGEIMFDIRTKIDSFMFFWFDGVYFTNPADEEIVSKILEEKKYLFKFEVLNKFCVRKDQQRKMIYITYNKGDEQKPKTFNLPIDLKIQTL